MGSQRRSAEENQEQMWRGNLLLHRHLKGSDKPIRDNQAWDWLKGRRVGKLSETGTHLVGEDSCDHRGMPLLCTSAALASHLQRHNPVIPWAGLAQHPGCCPWQQLTKDTWSRKKSPFLPLSPSSVSEQRSGTQPYILYVLKILISQFTFCLLRPNVSFQGF